jgi:hypothetical protein
VNGAALALILAAGAVAGYAVDLRRRPHRPCRKCHGTGTVWGSTDKRFGFCECRGKPPRLRAGAGLVNPKLRRK